MKFYKHFLYIRSKFNKNAYKSYVFKTLKFNAPTTSILSDKVSIFKLRKKLITAQEIIIIIEKKINRI